MTTGKPSTETSEVPQGFKLAANGVWHDLVKAADREAQEAVIARALMASFATGWSAAIRKRGEVSTAHNKNLVEE